VADRVLLVSARNFTPHAVVIAIECHLVGVLMTIIESGEKLLRMSIFSGYGVRVRPSDENNALRSGAQCQQFTHKYYICKAQSMVTFPASPPAASAQSFSGDGPHISTRSTQDLVQTAATCASLASVYPTHNNVHRVRLCRSLTACTPARVFAGAHNTHEKHPFFVRSAEMNRMSHFDFYACIVLPYA
jgi:hypothetical protein